MNISFFVATAHAAAFSLKPTGDEPTVEGGGTLTGEISSLTERAIEILLVVAAVLAVLYLMYSGIQYIISAGNPEQAKTARNGVVNAIIGIVIIMASFFIVRFASTLGTSLVNGDTGSNTSATTSGDKNTNQTRDNSNTERLPRVESSGEYRLR